MPRPVPVSRSIFSLDALASLASSPSCYLFISERTLYILQKLAALDVVDPFRYATTYYANGTYESVGDGLSGEDAYLSISELVQEEVYPMSGLWPISDVVINEVDTYITGTSGYFELIVPEGEMWELQAYTVMNEQHDCKVTVTTRDISSGEVCVLSYQDILTASVWKPYSVNTALLYGQKARFAFNNCTDLDHVYLKYHIVVYAQ